MTTGTKAPLEAISNIYNEFPAFHDVFDEDSFHIFAACFVLGTILFVVIASKFVTLKERNV
jgi:large subunit ribosomal protein L53